MLGTLSGTGPGVPDEIEARPWWRDEQARRAICRELQHRLERFSHPAKPDFDNARKSIDSTRAELVDRLHEAAWPHTPAGQEAARQGIERPALMRANPARHAREGRSGSGFGC